MTLKKSDRPLSKNRMMQIKWDELKQKIMQI